MSCPHGCGSMRLQHVIFPEAQKRSQFNKLFMAIESILQSFASIDQGSEFMTLLPWAEGRDRFLLLTN